MTQDANGAVLAPSPVRRWYVCHPDGPDLGLIAPTFDTESEAIAKRDLWNKDVPGHYVMGITEAPPDFSCLPNGEVSASAREKSKP